MKLIIFCLFSSITFTSFSMEQEPAAKQLAIFTQDDYTLYCAARRVADLVFKAAEELNNDASCPFTVKYFDNRRKRSVLSFFGEASQGLVLEYYFGNPSSIYTPWGKWKFRGCSHMFLKAGFEPQQVDTKSFHELALKKVGVSLQLLVAGVQKKTGYYGPYYAINALEGTILPHSIRPTSYNTVSDQQYKQVKEKWAAMTAKYDAEKH